jgi:hypothetical protein
MRPLCPTQGRVKVREKRLCRLLCGKPLKLRKNRVVGAALVAALGQPSRACGTPYDATAKRNSFTPSLAFRRTHPPIFPYARLEGSAFQPAREEVG